MWLLRELAATNSCFQEQLESLATSDRQKQRLHCSSPQLAPPSSRKATEMPKNLICQCLTRETYVNKRLESRHQFYSPCKHAFISGFSIIINKAQRHMVCVCLLAHSSPPAPSSTTGKKSLIRKGKITFWGTEDHKKRFLLQTHGVRGKTTERFTKEPLRGWTLEISPFECLNTRRDICSGLCWQTGKWSPFGEALLRRVLKGRFRRHKWKEAHYTLSLTQTS